MVLFAEPLHPHPSLIFQLLPPMLQMNQILQPQHLPPLNSDYSVFTNYEHAGQRGLTAAKQY